MYAGKYKCTCMPYLPSHIINIYQFRQYLKYGLSWHAEQVDESAHHHQVWKRYKWL